MHLKWSSGKEDLKKKKKEKDLFFVLPISIRHNCANFNIGTPLTFISWETAFLYTEAGPSLSS